MNKYYLAVDIGASSGRHIIGWQENGKILTKEVYRFPNGAKYLDGHLVWDINQLLTEVKNGIATAKEEFPQIESMSIDTWGVDYVLMNGDKEIFPCYSYRDTRTEPIIDKVHQIVPFEELYRLTGCQFQSFNTIYQLYDDQLQGRLDKATDFLMIPEYIMYKLTGTKKKEYTNATTTGLVNVAAGEFDLSVVGKLGFPKRLFQGLCSPKTVVGEYSGIKVVMCATHDTASAVEGIPMEENYPYISSGTWSLLGVKTTKPITDKASFSANYSNEGGVGYNRYQKNIMGMWLVNRLKDELCPDSDFSEIVKLAEESGCDIIIDANAAELLSPKSMKEAFDKLANGRLNSIGDYFRCAYLSLAESYKIALEELEKNTAQRYGKLFIVGGGAKNTFLNKLTEEATDRKVIALPLEATALGNLKIQMEERL